MGDRNFNDYSRIWRQDSLNCRILTCYHGPCCMGKLLVFYFDKLHLSLLGKDLERKKMCELDVMTISDLKSKKRKCKVDIKILFILQSQKTWYCQNGGKTK